MVSIIVPVYNAAAYIATCVDSILSQTYTDFELLLIDDGSKDNSGSICEEYATRDARVRVFHKSNGGVSSARNFGLDNAFGDWVVFMDSDDYWLASDVLEKLIKEGSIHDVDVVRGNYISVDSEGNIIERKNKVVRTDFTEVVLSGGKFLQECVRGEFFSVLWLIRRECIGDLRFREEQVFLEDMRFLIELTAKPLKCLFIDFPFYAYRKYASIGSSNQDIARIANSFEMCDFFWSQLLNSIDEEYKNLCYRYSVMMYCWTIHTLADDDYYFRRHEIINRCDLNNLRIRSLERMNKSKIEIDFKDKLMLRLPPHISAIIIRLYDKIYATLLR